MAILKNFKLPDFRVSLISFFLTVFLPCSFAVNYNVGPTENYAALQDVADLLNPGDSVFVMGNNSYPADIYIDRSGEEESPIVIKGVIPDGGSRPVIEGDGSYGINISANYIVLEGFEVSGMPKGIGVFGNHILVQGCVIHDCNHGLIGYGTGTGNVTVEYCEFYGNGVPTGGATQHQIYMATDEESYPGAVFRLRFSYLHDAVEGDNVKSRSERNEIYYNWIENAGSSGHGLGLFAPDPEDNANVDINTAREDADVVGNVIIQARNSCARIGGDAPGYPTDGRYRFVNNTFILTEGRGDVIRTFNRLETLEMYNNVMYAITASGDFRVLNDADGDWVHSPRSVMGSNNWVQTGFTQIPAADEWVNTFSSAQSPFLNAGGLNFIPAAGSEIVNTGLPTTPTFAEYPLENLLNPPVFHPPVRKLLEIGTAEVRPPKGAIDIGAFEASDGVGVEFFQHTFTQAPQYAIANRMLRFKYVSSHPENAKLSIYEPNGKLVAQLEETKKGPDRFTAEFQLPKMEPGLFVAMLYANGKKIFSAPIIFGSL